MTLEEVSGALLRRGLAHAELASVLSSLTAAGLLSHAGGGVYLPLFDAELDEHLAKFANRSAGREKLYVRAQVPRPRVPATPALVPDHQDGAAQKVAPSQSGKDETLPESRMKPGLKTKRQQLHRGQDNRFGATDGVVPDDSDPTVARILCECGGYAEITQSYIDHLKLAYRGLDVVDAVRRAALWCDGNRAKRKTMAGVRRFLTSWLNNQSRDAEMRAAVVRANSQRNGFGQGGAYDAPASPAGAACEGRSVGVASELDLDDLTVETERPAGSSKPDIQLEHATAVTHVSPVARARARVQVAAVVQPAITRQPASAQLRLSEQLR